MLPLYEQLSPLADAKDAATPWYLAGGVLAANCVAAYQPKSAAGLAASYANLANPGTYTATPGVTPTWDATNGWIFNGATQYLATGIIPANNQQWSMIIRFSNATAEARIMAGMTQNTSGYPVFYIIPNNGVVSYGNGNELFKSPVLSSGILAVAGNTGYRNGTPESGSISPAAGTFTRDVYIGAINYAGTPGFYKNCKIQATALYNTTLSAAQVAAITSAMQAL